MPAKRNEPLFCSTLFHSRQGYCAVPILWCLTAVHNCRKQHDQHLPLTAGTGKHPRQAAPACAVVSQQLEQSPPLVLQLPEQVNALPLMQGLSQSPGNNFVKQRGILKCLGDAVKLPGVSREMLKITVLVWSLLTLCWVTSHCS